MGPGHTQSMMLFALTLALLSGCRAIYDEPVPGKWDYVGLRAHESGKTLSKLMLLLAAVFWYLAHHLLGIGLVGALVSALAYHLVGMLWGLAWLSIHSATSPGEGETLSEEDRRMVVSLAINWPVNMTVEVGSRALAALWSLSTQAYFGTMNLLARLFLRGRR